VTFPTNWRAARPVATLPVLGLLLVGCGHGGGMSAQSSRPAATTGTEGVSTNRIVQRAVASCKRTVRGAPLLSGDEKAKLIVLCDKAGHGDLSGAKSAAIDVCYEIARALPAFAGTQAQAACPRR